jgi:hypothetical protein
MRTALLIFEVIFVAETTALVYYATSYYYAARFNRELVWRLRAALCEGEAWRGMHRRAAAAWARAAAESEHARLALGVFGVRLPAAMAERCEN